MICLFVELLFTSVLCESDYEEQTITVTNFHDYSINMKKAGDKLNIILPPKTLIFFSSKEGYEITVGSGPENHLFPDNKRRLYYASKQDIIWLYSTIDNLDFSFHTLCIGKINYKLMEKIDRIYISSNPEEYFSILEKSQVSNGTLHLNNIVWILGNSKIKCNVKQDIKTKAGFTYSSPTYYSFPFDNPEDYSDIDFKKYSNNNDEIEFYSALFAIPKYEDLHSTYNHHFSFSCSPVELADNYYSNYRAYIDPGKLSVSQLIERGQFHLYDYNHIVRGYDDGMIVEVDFSIFNTYQFLNEFYICIFPEVCEMGHNFLFNDQVFLVSHTKENQYLKSGNNSYVADTDLCVKIIIIPYDNHYYDTLFIVSTSPTEKLKIGPKTQENTNYTNDKNYTYIMGSLQNIQTKVTYTKGVTFKLLLLTKNKDIEINSGDIITGPFVAKIDPNAECEFETYPIGELKEGYIDEGCVTFLHPGQYAKTDFYASAKYGVYEDKFYDSPNQAITNFNEKGYVLARTPNLMYIQTRSGWSAEVVNPQYDGDNRIGSQYNKYAFYFSKADSQRIYVMFRKLSNNDDFEINFRSASINTIGDSRVIMFNEFPYKFSINKYISKEYKQINTKKKQFVWFFPALSYYYVASDFEIEYNYANGTYTTTNPSHYIKITDFCYNVSDYYYMGGDRYSCIKNYHSMPNGAIAFIGGLRNDQHDSGVLPDEPKIYYDFYVNTTYGIHILDEKNNNPGDDSSDETIDEDQTNEYFPVEDTVELDGNGIQQSYDMSKIDKLILFVHDIYVIVIHSMEGFIVKAYSSRFNNDLFGTINDSSDKKIIYFTSSQGRIEIIRNNNAKILSRSDELFVYSGFSIGNINSFHDDMLISTNPNSNYTIKNSALDDSNEYNYSLSNDKKYAMWFTSPIEFKVTCEYNLPHKQYVYIDGERDFDDDIKTEFIGNNIFFYLSPQSNKDVYGIAKYHISPVNDEDISKISNYYQVNTILNTKSDQGIFGPGVDDKNDPKKPNEPKKPPASKIGIIIAAILIVIVIVIIIVVIVVCVRRHKKKNNSSEENSGPCDTQNKSKTAEI